MTDQITTHDENALNRLITQYKNSGNIKSIISAFTDQIQELEDTFFDLLNKRVISVAEGEQLDQLGTILDEPRRGFSDDIYRVKLLSKISRNISEGTPEDLIGIFKILMQAGLVAYSENYPAEINMMAVDSSQIGSDEEIKEAILGAKPAGVALIYLGKALTGYFGFLNDPNASGFGVGIFSSLFFHRPTFGFQGSPGKFIAGFGSFDNLSIGGVLTSLGR